MVDLDRIHVYAWDARPYPAFPADTDVWGDGANWRLGHWLTGRLASAPLDATVAAILADYGFAAHDAGALTGLARRLRHRPRAVRARGPAAAGARLLLRRARERGPHRLRPSRRRRPSSPSSTPDDLVESRPGAALATLTRAQETDLPASAKLTYISAAGDYPAAVEEARRLAGRSGRVAIADLPLVLEPEQAAQIAEIWLFEAWAARERAAFALPPSRLALEPGDVVSFAADGRSRLLRITEIGEHGARDIEARGIDPDDLRRRRTGRAPAARRRAGASSASRSSCSSTCRCCAATSPRTPATSPPPRAPGPARIAFYRSPEASGFLLKAMARRAGRHRRHPRSAARRRHLALRPRQHASASQLDQGSLASVTELALLAGANVAAIRNADGEWEVLQFQSAVLTAPATYELSGFLRGQAGTEHAMRAPARRRRPLRPARRRAGARRHEPGRDRPRLQLEMRPRQPRHRPRLLSRDRRTPSSGVGLRPLSPVHVRGTRAVGDLAITWVRRTRIGGDSWDAVEVPLGEDAERYEVDILDGANVVRTLTATSPTATYTAAQQTADFGAPQSSISLRIYQLSATRGRGTPRSAVL